MPEDGRDQQGDEPSDEDRVGDEQRNHVVVQQPAAPVGEIGKPLEVRRHRHRGFYLEVRVGHQIHSCVGQDP